MKEQHDWRDTLAGLVYLAVMATVISTVLGVPFAWCLAGLSTWLVFHLYRTTR